MCGRLISAEFGKQLDLKTLENTGLSGRLSFLTARERKFDSPHEFISIRYNR
jgi:hypothetical protein